MKPTTSKSKASTTLKTGKPKVLTSNNSTYGCSFIEEFTFKNKHKVPLYDVTTYSAFNQLIGHAKFANSSYGNVYYRGINGLFDNVLPSIMRKVKSGKTAGLENLLDKIYKDNYMFNSMAMVKENPKDAVTIRRFNKYRIEALLQHYSGNTRFIDVVDNHWVALWMGLQNFIFRGEGYKNCDCQRREINFADYYEDTKASPALSPDLNIYEYIVLLAMPYGLSKADHGIIETEDLVEVDLRKALPSIYLRPHAQHALVIRKKENTDKKKDSSFYDMASQAVAILRIRIDRASSWLGQGNLVSKENLFPSPAIDQGYHRLLRRTDLFDNPFEIIKYF